VPQNLPRYVQFPVWHDLEGDSTRPLGATLVIGIRCIFRSKRIADHCRMRTGSSVVRLVEFFLACHCKDGDESVSCSAIRIEKLIDSFVAFIMDKKEDDFLFPEYE
jgi:hypothetical protein